MSDTDRLIAAILAGAKCGQGAEHETYLQECDAFLALMKKRGKSKPKGKFKSYATIHEGAYALRAKRTR